MKNDRNEEKDYEHFGPPFPAVCSTGWMRCRFCARSVAAQVAAVTGEKAKHIRDGGLNNRYYRDLIIELIGKHQPVSREEINELLLDKLPEVLNQDQKMDKIHNLVSSLSGKRIRNIGSRRTPRWVLLEDDKQ